MLRNWGENQKYLWMSYADFDVHIIANKYISLVKFFNDEKTWACYGFQVCDMEFLKPPLHTHTCLRVSLSEAAIVILKL